MKRLNGFSLMEMMVVLSIVAIVAAASAPMVNKKMVRETTDTSLWKRTVGSSIGYNMSNNNDNDNTTVGIGTSVSRPDNTNPKLYISSRTDTTPHIMFGHNGGHLYRFTGGGQNDNIWLSNLTMPLNNLSNTVVLGRDNQVVGTDQVAIGREITGHGQGGVAIGRRAELLSSSTGSIAIGSRSSSNAVNTISIGSSASTVGANAIALGTGSISRTADSIAIGRKAEAAMGGNGAIAIGQESLAASSAVAIGSPGYYGSNANTQAASRAIAIGDAAQARGIDSIAMSSNTRVNSENSIAIGRGANVEDFCSGAVAIGAGSSVGHDSVNSMAIGQGAMVAAGNNNSVSIGPNVTVSSTNNAIMAIGQGMSVFQRGTDINVTPVGGTSNKTIVLGDANTRVIIPGTLVPTNLEISNLAVRGNIYVKDHLYVGKRGYFGLNQHPKQGRFPNRWQGDTSIIFGASPIDDNQTNKWVFDGHSGNSHSNWEYYGLAKKENSVGAVCLVGNNPDDTARFVDPLCLNSSNQENLIPLTWRIVNEMKSKFNESSTWPSDRRLKNVGKTFKGGLAELKKLDLFHYTYKDDTTKTPHVGVIAQDLQKIFPDAVTKGEDGFLRIRMEDMFYALVNAVKELDTKQNAQDKRIAELEKQNKELLKRLEAIEKIKN